MKRSAKRSNAPCGAVSLLIPAAFAAVLAFGFAYLVGFTDVFHTDFHWAAALADPKDPSPPPPPPLDKNLYDIRMMALAEATTTAGGAAFIAERAASAAAALAASSTPKKYLWPAAGAPYPADGRALLPFDRIIAYYGNFYSKGMGVLGQYPEDEMIAKLKDAVAEWQAADPETPVVPAIDYIAVTAQGSAGADGMYRARMPDSQIDHALDLAKEVDGIVILDVQVGLSTLQKELPLLSKYLALPNVHLAIDPEFSMKDGTPPGDEIGTFSSADINYASGFLADLVKKNNLPPKILVVHRFTEEMVTGARNITPLPEVEIVMDMDGWGFPAKKINTYNSVVYPEPVQFTGFKLFYKNDLKPPSTRLMTPEEVLSLKPAPVFIQYQ